MNKRRAPKLTLLAASLAIFQAVSAQGPPPPPPPSDSPPCWPPPCVPVDGGLIFAIAVAAIFGAWYVFAAQRKKSLAGR